MKKQLHLHLTFLCLLVTLLSVSKLQAQSTLIFDELSRKDSLLFKAIADCELSKLDGILSKDFVFCHDNGYTNVTTKQSLTDFKNSIEKNFCQKGIQIKRKVVKGSLQLIEVSSTKVIETGTQRFYSLENKLLEESKFSRVWEKQKEGWKMTQELDYLVNTKLASVPDKGNTLYNEIAHMDSVLFNAFNTHNYEVLKNIFTEDLEFYHDKGGLMNYAQNMASFKNLASNNNGLNRKLVEGSMEVYPVKDYGAIQVGEHTFCHKENGKDDCGTFKFLHIWQKKDGVWKISRVASYDH